MPSAIYKHRSRVAVAARLGATDKLEDARRDLAAAKLEDYIKRTVDAAPPLTDDQRERIASLLRPTAGAATEAVTRGG